MSILQANEIRTLDGEVVYKQGQTIANDSVEHLSQLLAVNPDTKAAVNVLNYHSGLEGGGGVFYWDATKAKSEHNGGTIVDPTAVFPTDWTDLGEQAAWFISENSGDGCWVRVISDLTYYSDYFGVKKDGTTVDSIPLMMLCGTVKTGTVIFSAGRYLINYESAQNPFFLKAFPGGRVGSKDFRGIAFFSIENMVIRSEGAEIFVQDNAKTREIYEANFGMFTFFDKVINVEISGFTLDGNFLNQPMPANDTRFINRNHGFIFFTGAEGFKDVTITKNYFYRLGWYDILRSSYGDYAGDGILTFGCKNITNLVCSDNYFEDVGRWAMALDILQDREGKYENITFKNNTMVDKLNLTLGHPNKTRVLGLVDIEVSTDIDNINISDNFCKDTRMSIAMGGGGALTGTDMVIQNVRIERNTLESSQEFKWYFLGFGTDVTNDVRSFRNVSICDNKIQVHQWTFIRILTPKAHFVNLTFSRNLITAEEMAPADPGAAILRQDVKLRGETVITDNVTNNLRLYSLSFTEDTLNRVHIFGNQAFNYMSRLSVTVEDTATDTQVFIADKVSSFGANCYLPADGQTNSKIVCCDIFSDNTYRLGTTAALAKGMVINTAPRPLSLYENRMVPMGGYAVKGQRYIDLTHVSNPITQFKHYTVCTTSGFVFSSFDKVWSAGFVISINPSYGERFMEYDGRMYLAGAGELGTEPPIHTIGEEYNGTCLLRYYGPKATFADEGVR